MANQDIKYRLPLNTKIGTLQILFNDTKLCGLYLDGQKTFQQSFLSLPIKQNALSQKVVKWINDYFANKHHGISFDLDLCGTNNQKIVWNTLLPIPYGKTISYKELSLMVKNNHKISIHHRVIANMIGKNPILLIIPCHRVVGSNGKLCGFAAGIPNKHYLIEHEKAII